MSKPSTLNAETASDQVILIEYAWLVDRAERNLYAAGLVPIDVDNDTWDRAMTQARNERNQLELF